MNKIFYRLDKQHESMFTSVEWKIMRVFILFIVIGLGSVYANIPYSQEKIDLDVKNISLENLFKEIQGKSKYVFFYKDEIIDENVKITLQLKNAELQEVLNQSFKKTNLDYVVADRQVIVKEKEIVKVKLDQQQVAIKGTVTDEFGMPIPGANVVVKGTTKGTITDFDGNYQLNISDKNAILVFSYVGYKDKEVAVDNQTVVNVVLQQDVSELDAVVMVGYGSVKKSDVTGAVASVSTEEISKTQNTSIAQAIQGRAAGVTVSKTSGAPGANPTVRIRGVGTVNNADPLYVVDGIPINDISSINMEDAKSIEVLKDASATAIYGSRGANGVVLITTKTGKKGAPTISYRTYVGVQNRIDNLDVLNAEQWATMYNEGLANDGSPLDPDLLNPSSLTSQNWKDLAYRTGIQQNHQLSFSGGTDKSSYYVSFGYIDQKGVVKESSYERTNFRVNNTYQIKPKVKIGHNIQYANAKKESVQEFGNSTSRAAFLGYLNDPVSPIYNADGSYAASQYNSIVGNPLALIEYGTTPTTNESFLGNLFLEADIVKGLTFKSNLGLQINNTKVDRFVPAYFVSGVANAPLSTYTLNRNENRVFILSNTLNYNTTIAKKHNVNVLLGQEIQELNSNNVNTSRNGIPESVANPTLEAGDVSTAAATGTISESKLLSFFGRFNYNYDDRYLITGTYRMDGSSRFGANNRWAQFPSLALGWNIHKEDFYDIDFMNQLKFRAGWGETGNQNIPNTAIYNTLNIGTNYVYGSDQATSLGVAPLTPGNADLKWETTITKNIGLDFAFLNNSITFTADYFIKNTTDMLMPTPILISSGYINSPYTNAGDIENKGLEFTANYKKIINDFSFNVGGNISFIKNKVVKLATDGSIIQTGTAQSGLNNLSRTEAGHSLASFYGYEMIGLFQNQDEIDNYASLPNVQPGDVKYRDVNNDGVIDDDDRKYIGSPLPKFTYGINLDMNYKQFDFTAFFQGSYGNKIFNASDYDLKGDLSTNLNTSMLNRWTGEGTSNSIPRATFTNLSSNSIVSSRFVQDGSYLRLKNVQLGYSLPKSFLKKTSITKLRMYASAQNLITFTDYDGLDPEVGVDGSTGSPLDIGIDRGRYPSVRTLSLGFDINF
ncbi:TonB-linked SusC/RagA family outer membrane protein [Wenyingzhuangia heitensis]|uniref:TonB-linked SusC/RagA family outer membrane protein n=1 Tax=Wenyingzhuangia heitensis TaxID=1487859 RepID=A0ABX0U6V1_9FLAO|nr:TonB-dependent receptor [Wenyingzhuangia heitensis]NIJ43908.1 TonB-linked SusC/RagA family outer membrane protein [Wenyingzhuangia heitensis]